MAKKFVPVLDGKIAIYRRLAALHGTGVEYLTFRFENQRAVGRKGDKVRCAKHLCTIFSATCAIYWPVDLAVGQNSQLRPNSACGYLISTVPNPVNKEGCPPAHIVVHVGLADEPPFFWY